MFVEVMTLPMLRTWVKTVTDATHYKIREMKKIKPETDPIKIFICDCYSFKHQAIFWLDFDDKQLYVTIHLTTHRNFFKRLWYGLKYAFGYTSNYGAWDEFLFRKEDEKKLLDYLKT
jgi:hypothetical protein